MKRFFWELFYTFKKPTTKTEVVLWYCRIHGIKYSHLKNTKIAFKEFKASQIEEEKQA